MQRKVVIGTVVVVVIAVMLVLATLAGIRFMFPALTTVGTAPEALSATIDQLRFLLGGLTVLLTAIVAIQAIFQFRQSDVQHYGVRQVSEVMGVITETLQSRLDAEKEARAEAKDLQTAIAGIQDDLKQLRRLRDSFNLIIKSQREEIEASAEELSQTRRHDFRLHGDRLRGFARQFETFRVQHQPLEEKAQEFSAKALYIRGIAAHYANDPATSKICLEKVTQLPPTPGEPERSYKRRKANAYYYLGIIGSNFMTGDATASFEEALKLDTDTGDFLTMVVYAEALAMSKETDLARKKSDDIVKGIRAKFTGELEPLYQRLNSRAMLVQANVEILEHNSNYWAEVERLLTPVLAEDPRYYYAVVTLAQAHASQGKADAKRLFQEALTAIETSNDLLAVTEARSQVLLRMTAALCCVQKDDLPQADEHVGKARQHLNLLPSMDTASCTVFSVLSKLNENSTAIEHHLGLIRDGQVAL